MATEYVETQAPEDDLEGDILEQMARGELYVFAVCTIVEREGAAPDLHLRLATNISQAQTVRSILEKTIAALPADGE